MTNYTKIKDNTKQCSKCLLWKNVKDFSFDKRAKNGLQTRCKTCSYEDHKHRYSTNKDYRIRVNKKNMNNSLITRYGITLEDRNELAENQNYLCAICLIPFNENDRRRTCHVDHCHKTGIVRGLLCANCNTGLGMFFDNQEILSSAINYLKDYSNGG